MADLEVEDSGVVLRQTLVWRNHPVEELFVEGEAGYGGQQPAVTFAQKGGCNTLVVGGQTQQGRNTIKSADLHLQPAVKVCRLL